MSNELKSENSAGSYWRERQWPMDPFQDTVPNGQYFYSPQLSHQLILLEHLANYSQMLLCVIGPLGIGKSCLLQCFGEQLLNGPVLVNIFNANSNIKSKDWVELISSGFELDPDIAEQSAGSLSLFLQNLNRDTKRPLMFLIDDADLIAPSELMSLLEAVVSQPDPKLLHLVLAGTDQLRRHIQTGLAYQNLQEHLHFTELNHFTPQETKEYIQQRLNVAGISELNVLAEKHYRYIYTQSQGFPALINRYAKQCLQVKRRLPIFSLLWAGIKENYLIILGGLLMVFSVLVLPWLRDRSNKLPAVVASQIQQNQDEVRAANTTPTQLSLEQLELLKAQASIPKLPELPWSLNYQVLVSDATETVNSEIPALDANKQSAKTSSTESRQLPVIEKPKPLAESSRKFPVHVELPSVLDLLVLEPLTQADLEPPLNNSLAADDFAALAVASVEIPVIDQTLLTISENKNKPQQIARQDKKDKKKNMRNASLAVGIDPNVQELLSFSGGDYTVQVAADPERARVRAIARKVPPFAKQYIYFSQGWWRLVIGHFKTYEQAKQIADQIQKTTGLKPWIKRIRLVHQEISKKSGAAMQASSHHKHQLAILQQRSLAYSTLPKKSQKIVKSQKNTRVGQWVALAERKKANEGLLYPARILRDMPDDFMG